MDLAGPEFYRTADLDNRTTASSSSAATKQAVVKTSLYLCNFVFLLQNKTPELIFTYLLLLFQTSQP